MRRLWHELNRDFDHVIKHHFQKWFLKYRDSNQLQSMIGRVLLLKTFHLHFEPKSIFLFSISFQHRQSEIWKLQSKNINFTIQSDSQDIRLVLITELEKQTSLSLTIAREHLNANFNVSRLCFWRRPPPQPKITFSDENPAAWTSLRMCFVDSNPIPSP